MARTKKVTKTENQITMTQSSLDELKKELAHRQDVLRVEIAEEISAARDLGDLSENHAYTVAMEKKEMNENRINELESIIALVFVVEEPTNDNFVSVGETIQIENVENKQKRNIILVGSEDSKSANPAEGKLSTDSPIGKAVLNAQVGDVVEVKLPNGKVNQFKIVKFVR